MKKVAIDKNEWHPRQDLDEVIDTIKKLSVDGDFSWSWSRNWDCKYVSINFDMRDGAFTIRNKEGNRILLDQLKYQTPRES